MNLLSSTAVFSFFTLISRVLGYLRDIMIAIFLGASVYADAFFVAFRLPNTFRRLFAEGTFNAAFIPSYTSERLKSNIKADKFAKEVLTLLVIILFILVLLVEIFTPFIVYLIAPGFIANAIKFDLAVELTKITFPFLFLVSISSLFAGILNSNNKFAAAAAAPIILNIILILSLIISYYYKSDFVKNLSYGVTLSGLLQLLFLIYFCRKYFKPSIEFKKKISNKVKFFLKKLVPSILSSGVTQINILVGTIIASFQAGAVSYLYYADRVYQINLAIAGIAVGTVSLPVLANAIKKNNNSTITKIQNKSIELSLLLSVPAAAGLIIGSEEIISALFGYGSFSIEDVSLTSKALKLFGLGIPAFALIKILSNFYFARDNTKVPFHLSIIIVSINVLVSLIFFKEFGFLIIPFATTLSTWIGVIFYVYLLLDKKYLNFLSLTFKNLFKIFLSTLLMSFILYYGLDYYSDKLEYSNTFKFLYLLFVVIIAAILYLFSCYFTGVLKYKSFKA